MPSSCLTLQSVLCGQAVSLMLSWLQMRVVLNTALLSCISQCESFDKKCMKGKINKLYAINEIITKRVFPFMGTRTASPRGRYGERPQRDSVWRYICKNTTCWPATAHDVTTGVPQYKCRRENTSSAFSSSLTDLFEACKVKTGKSTVFFLLWRALARRLGSVWIRVLVIWHPMTHTTVASFVWAWSTHAMPLRGWFACIVSGSLWGCSALACPSFRGKRGSRLLPAIQVPPLPRHGGEWNRGARRRI